MSTFAELIALPGCGVTYGFEVSLDRFATVAYRYGLTAGLLDGSNEFQPRILALGNLARELGVDNAISLATIEVTLNNTDAGVDWLVDSISTALRSQWKLWCRAWRPSNPSDFATKMLGVFMPMDLGERDSRAVTLTLVDRFGGDGAELALTPTLSQLAPDLYAEGILSTSSFDTCIEQPLVDPSTRLPLAFGGGANMFPTINVVAAQARALAVATGAQGPHAFVVCCTTSSDPVNQDELLFLGYPNNIVPRVHHGIATWINYIPDQYWVVFRSSVLTSDGKSWKVIWIKLDTLSWARNQPTIETLLMNDWLAKAGPPWVSGFPLSARTYVSPTRVVYGQVRGPEVAYDLLRYYSRGLVAADIDTQSFTDATQACTRPVSGYLNREAMMRAQPNGRVEFAGGALKEAVSLICQASGFDVFTKWDGSFKAMALRNSFADQTTTPVALVEELLSNVKDYVPAPGQRWAPFNRVFCIGAGATSGPWDVPNVALATWDRVRTRTFDLTWLADGFTRPHFEDFVANIDVVVRRCLRFRYPVAGLALELGDYVTCAWTRGGRGTPYSASTIWRVEGLSLAPGAESAAPEVEVLLVWMGELLTEAPYLLDDEAHLTRATGSAGRTVTLTYGLNKVTFSSGNLFNDGAEAGDTLIIKDANEADDTWRRNKVMLIASVDNATQLTIDTSRGTGVDFGAGGPYVLSTWEIRRGAGTYHTSSSDPVNYPSGGAMYGKTCEATSDVYSDSYAGAIPANRLLNG